ncbi:mitochondrial ribosomal protein subunit L20-domain-containing protein [Coniella lustricola]|uniref:Mitochondrial ribosomal protein subunit L20-domain-containing protein n=1 Tax=Coniella lustricola TaxID=2025994 RepID=A0A2T3AFY0_9PEZI|nr:mitochondrial ribosomal protein subunit L20-domain-containing protein [Coniella lustricola]
MEASATALLCLRPAAAAARRCLPSTRSTLKHQIRNKATSARTKRALNIAPHPSFLASSNGAAVSPSSSTNRQYDNDTIIFNPPSAAPSVYHTPFKFLPKTDPRRRANLASLFESHFGPGSANIPGSPSSSSATSVSELPEVGVPKVMFTRGPITREEVEEMRHLRTTDPYKWSVKALSLKYEIPIGFVMACCQAPKEKIDFERRKFELLQQRWGSAKRKAHDERVRRNEMLYRNEI